MAKSFIESVGGSDTDEAWERWGRLEPYYGVLTDPAYKMSAMDMQARHRFFESGRIDVEGVIRDIRRYVAADFNPDSVLEFGCGVGRLVIPFARLAREVVGLDVARSMLDRARENCALEGLTNIRLEVADDSLSAIASRKFDLVHSAIVFQHIRPDRGMRILEKLIDCIAPAGVGAIQLLYSNAAHVDTNGVAPDLAPAPELKWYERVRKRGLPDPPEALEPEMQMNPYGLNEVFFLMQRRRVCQFHSRFTDHGGELGLWLFFKLPDVLSLGR